MAQLRFRIIPSIESFPGSVKLFRVRSTVKPLDQPLNERLAARGFRFTSQREHVYHVLLAGPDHPTAEQVFLRAKKGMPDISMATVYNCLDTLVKSGLVREVNVDRAAMRYCPNMQDHGHFYCEECGSVFDIYFTAEAPMPQVALPRGCEVAGLEVSMRGACPKCAGGRRG